MGNLSDEKFADELMNTQMVDGYVQVYSNSQPISNPYNLTMKKAQLFDFTYNLTKKIDSENINQKSVFYLTCNMFDGCDSYIRVLCLESCSCDIKKIINQR